MKEETINFSEIEVDERMRTRPIESARVRRIAELIAIGEYPPPMVTCRAGKRYLLLDGHHRHEAWKRAFNGHDGSLRVHVADCADEKEQYAQAIESNIKQGNNYTIAQIGALFSRLTRETGFSKSEARKLLRLTEEHADKLEESMVVMEATEEKNEEIAIPEEATVVDERAEDSETPEDAERAVVDETPGSMERAAVGETPDEPERADYNAIRFHVERLQTLLPSTWADARKTLDNLTYEIIKAMKKETEK
ncbi:hypothetical protein ES705_36413 [subsurface metagenome]